MNKPVTQRLGGKPDPDMTELLGHVRKLSSDLHTVKGNLAANSSMTKDTLDRQIEMREHQVTSDKKLDDVIVKSEEMLAVFNAGKKGVSFFQWIGRFLYRLARWAGPILAVGSAIWLILHGQPPSPKGHE